MAAGLAAAGLSFVVPAVQAGPLASASGPELVSNASFESSSTTPVDWTISGAFLGTSGNASIDNDPSHAQTGTKSFTGFADGDFGLLSQDLQTQPGGDYDIHFYVANFGGFADGTELEVVWNGETVYDATNLPTSGYQEVTIDPLATGNVTRLQFGFRADQGSLNLDSVSVRALAVPEPGVVALLAAGLGLGLATRRRRRA